MTRLLTYVLGFIAVGLCAQNVRADESMTGPAKEMTWSEFRLSDEPSSSVNVEPRQSTNSETRRIRQQRAAYRYNQRIARAEYNAWIGYEPLRPTWSSVPMMSSRYPDYHRTIVIPVYVP